MTAEQDRAADPGTSAWVAASAGTGKTHVLANRVLRLLLSGARPGGILCLTFTKAAAAEMANRINQELARWARLPDHGLAVSLQDLNDSAPTDQDMVTARRLFAEVLDVPGGLKIQTIHAFCQSLTGRFPLEAGVAPHASIMDERSTRELLNEATNRVLANAAEDQDGRLGRALELISASTTDMKLPDLVTALMSQRRRLAQVEADRIYPLMGVEPGLNETWVLEDACTSQVADTAALQHAVSALSKGSKTDRERADTIAGWLNAPDSDRRKTFDTYRGAFLTKSSGYLAPRKAQATKPIQDKHPDAVAVLEAEAIRLVRVEEQIRSSRVARATEALVVFGHALNDTYETLKRQRAALDYDDLILVARRLVAEPDSAAWVLYKLDEGLDHILVDEAQDTNPDQWAVVEALAAEFFAGQGAHEHEAPRTVFAVGDAKQSIYSFQRADPAEFERTRQAFQRKAQAADQPFHNGLLDLSFRSTEAVLALVDAVFEGDVARNGMLFSDQERDIRHQAHRQDVAGRIELWDPEVPEKVEQTAGWQPPVKRLDVTNPDVRLARRIAGRIKHWLNTRAMLEARARPIRADDVLILVRRRNPFFNAMVRELKRQGVPVAGIDRMILTEQLAVMDLLALARFVLMPEDDLTLATVLKSPLLGLDDDQLYKAAYDRDNTLWHALAKRAADDPALAAAHGFLKDCLAMADQTPPFEFFSSLLEHGGRRAILARLGPDALDPMNELLALSLDYERTHVPSLQGFVHWVEAAETEVKREMEQASGEVRVMTVHGAKGLQAPIVFLPDTCGAPTQAPDLYWTALPDSAPALIWPASAENRVGAAAEAHEKAVALRDQEYNRQLYVALTRAADELYICGYETQRGRPKHCWYNLIEEGFDRLEAHEGVDSEGLPVRWMQSGTLSDNAEKEGAVVTPTSEAPDWANRAPPEEPSPSRPLAPSRPAFADSAVRSPLSETGQDPFMRGNLMHRLLQRLPDLPEADRRAAALRFLKQPAHGLEPGTAEGWAEEVLAVLNDPSLGALFAPGSAAEVPVTGLVGRNAVSGQIDRLAVTADSVLIVDYKTNRPPPETLNGVPQLYCRQMAAYRALIEQVYPGRTVRCALLWTDGPTLMELPPEMLDGASGEVTAS
ncbi:MAG: double-strand break repair helicase AddA [Alphaproteobacteria bacterium]